MSALDTIREQIKKLYATNPVIHMDVSLTTPRLTLKNAEVTIKSIYPHVFRIEESLSGTPKCHTLQYSDVLIRHIVISELEKKGKE